MAHFYGTLQGGRGQATRCGTKSSGVKTVAASWEGSVQVSIRYDDATGQNMAEVWLMPWHGRGDSRLLYDGPVSGGERKEPMPRRSIRDLKAGIEKAKALDANSVWD